MTLIVGIKCRDGVVLGSDGAATYGAMGQTTIRQPVRKKLRLLGNQGVVGVAGAVGLGQRIAGELELARNQGVPIGTPPKLVPLANLKPHQGMGVLRELIWNIVGREMDLARLTAQTINNPAPLSSCMCSSVACLLIGAEPCLIQFDQQAAPEMVSDDLPFAAIGSGQIIADPFLAFLRRVYWRDALPDVEQGVFSAVWTLHHAIETHPGGVGPPIQLVTVQKDGRGVWAATEMPEARWQEHLQFIKTMEAEMATLPELITSRADAAPAPPEPPPG